MAESAESVSAPAAAVGASADQAVLVFNAGSSSLKYEMLSPGERTLLKGTVSRIGGPKGHHELTVGEGEPHVSEVVVPDHSTAVRQAFADLSSVLGDECVRELRAVGHRVVHGGPQFWRPTLIDDGIVETLVQHVELAPLHNGPSTRAIQAAREAFPDVPHVAVFDTGFHHDLPEVARTYALPFELTERFRLRRYGFHGISSQYLLRRVGELGIEPRNRLIICHLGSGASLTAVRDGRSVDTSMGLTPLEGLVMQTRAGDLDPGLLLFLQRHIDLDADELDRLLERGSGLRGLSGETGDYAQLEELAGKGNRRATFALEVFAYRIRKYLGAYTAVLGGVDVVVFAGGIGEHSASARASILEPLTGLGWHLDPDLNGSGAAERRISPPDARPELWVIPTRETLMIARETRALLEGGSSGTR